ncbi:BTB/POZ domain-containing protein kctd15 isoform X2 [Lingula anatina]|nr:BTB/POZ domain-containing protein kctd15 isoform X2 [Lingula anatina]|eukprot:XP_013409143.1 BTB/POZ domain-containing protein kctd15 isoform X2 [Lingula anatina]
MSSSPTASAPVDSGGEKKVTGGYQIIATNVTAFKTSPSPALSGGSPSPVSNHSAGFYSPHMKISGVPCPATPTRYTAPVHIDVGGSIYTSSLETLTKYPDSRLGRMFNGSIPIILDSLKQHYFIDRDGKIFRHVLNFLRTSQLVLPDDFTEWELLHEEVRYYDIAPLTKAVETHRKERQKRKEKCDCVAVHISPELGERVCLSAERALLDEIFPELNSALEDGRNSGWNLDNRFVIRFPVNGFCKLNSLQVLQRLIHYGFNITASTGGGVEGQQFSEYLLLRQSKS